MPLLVAFVAFRRIVQECLEFARVDTDQTADANRLELAAGNEPPDCANARLQDLGSLLRSQQATNRGMSVRGVLGGGHGAGILA